MSTSNPIEKMQKKQEKTCVYQKFLLILRGILGKESLKVSKFVVLYDGFCIYS